MHFTPAQRELSRAKEFYPRTSSTMPQDSVTSENASYALLRCGQDNNWVWRSMRTVWEVGSDTG